MLRIVLFLVTAALLALGIAWFADRPGEVIINWLGYRIETSVLVAGLCRRAACRFHCRCLVGLSRDSALARSGLAVLPPSPRGERLSCDHARADCDRLRRCAHARGSSADEAARLSPGDPLALLLTAQSAQMAGDRAAAERAFREMTRRDETKLLGLRGLYIEAQRRNDADGARLFAEEAAKVVAELGLGRAGRARLSHRCGRLGRRYWSRSTP